jgi:hypothetical protein
MLFSSFKNTSILLLFLFYTACRSNEPERFDFLAIGDIPYHLPEDFDRFETLINDLNQQQPAFTIHIGDIKSGSTPCSDEYFERIHGYFQQFEHPLIYTPGDNEWTDCHRDACGNYDPEERLDKLRQLFFSESRSQGKKTMPLQTQNQFEGFEKFVENALWETGKVSFGTIHVVGSNNNLQLGEEVLNDEFYEREMANLFWLVQIFNQAKQRDHRGVVLMLHAGLNYRSEEESNGHKSFVNQLREEVMDFGKPVLLVYGDFHRFMIDKPLVDEDRKVLTNFTAVQVFGDRDMHAVKIKINPKNPNLFEIHQHFVEGN